VLTEEQGTVDPLASVRLTVTVSTTGAPEAFSADFFIKEKKLTSEASLERKRGSWGKVEVVDASIANVDSKRRELALNRIDKSQACRGAKHHLGKHFEGYSGRSTGR
jgi:hypothetical protein